MTEQNTIKQGEEIKTINIKLDEEIKTIKIIKEYDIVNDTNIDNDLLEYSEKKMSKEEEDLINKKECRVFKIVLEDEEKPNRIRDIYDEKRSQWTEKNPDKYAKCAKGIVREIKKCVDDQLPQLYSILVVKKTDIIPPDVAPIVSQTPPIAQPQPIVAQTQPIVAQTQPIVVNGGTRRRRNNKKNKRKSRNNRKKTNRRR